MNNGAFEAGKKIRDGITIKGEDLQPTVYKIKEAGKRSKFELVHEYLTTCLNFNVQNADNSVFLEEIMSEDENIREDVALSICLGIMSADDDYISFKEAAMRWDIDRTTIQKAKDSGRFNEGEWQKRGRDLFIKVSAMQREYGQTNE